jgi:hypothetical protein
MGASRKLGDVPGVPRDAAPDEDPANAKSAAVERTKAAEVARGRRCMGA